MAEWRVQGRLRERYECDCPNCKSGGEHFRSPRIVDRVETANSAVVAEYQAMDHIVEYRDLGDVEWCELPTTTRLESDQ